VFLALPKNKDARDFKDGRDMHGLSVFVVEVLVVLVVLEAPQLRPPFRVGFRHSNWRSL